MIKYLLLYLVFFANVYPCMISDNYKVSENKSIRMDCFQYNHYVHIEITPELRELYFAIARLNDWFHLPEFANSSELPTDPLNYWFMLLSEGAFGWDRYGNSAIKSPWLKYGYLNIESYFPIAGMENNDIGYYYSISAEEFDDWVKKHFGAVELEHIIHANNAYYEKNYFYDGKNYYNTCNSFQTPQYWELNDLIIQKSGNKTIYTAYLTNYIFDEYSIFLYDESHSLSENMASYASVFNYATGNNSAVFSVYGKRIMLNELSMDQAIQQMIIDGQTAEFISNKKIEVKFYFNELSEPFYLSVKAFE